MPETQEQVIALPKVNGRYFHELVAGGLWLVTALLAALGMLYMVMFHGGYLPLRLFYFVVIAVALGVMMLGIKIIMDGEAERLLALKVAGREWVLDAYALHISIALVEGLLSVHLRKNKLPTLAIQRKEILSAKLEPKGNGACLVISTSGIESQQIASPMEVRLLRTYLAGAEEKIRDQLALANITLTGDWASPPSSQSGPPAPQT